MATVASFQQQGKQDHIYGTGGATVRSMSSVSTASVASASAANSWVQTKKRDWDNAFLSKYHDFETTLQENDKWLAIYWQNIAGMKDTKKPSMAITEALKTSSSKRRVRSRMDVRDVFFAGSISSAASSNGTLRMSPPYGSQFNTATMYSYKKAKQRRRSSQYGSMQGNTLNMTLAEMAMIPPKSPYLTNVASPPSAATTLASSGGLGSAPEAAGFGSLQRRKDIASGLPSLRTQRSQESTLANKVVEMRRQPSGTLVRSNSTAAQTAAAVKLLQETPSSPPETALDADAMDDQEETIPDRSMTPEPEQPKQQQRFTPLTTVPTLRDMILYRQSPSKTQAPKQKTPPLTNIDMALGSLSLDAASRKQKAVQGPPQDKELSTPSKNNGIVQHPRTVSNASSQGSAGTSRSEEDVRERLQRIRIALSRTNTAAMQAVDEHEDELSAAETSEAELETARKRIDRIEAALSPETTAADITALCNDIDEVENMLPPSAHASPTQQRSAEGEQRKSSIYVDVDIDVNPIDVRLDSVTGNSDSDDAHHTSPGKRKHSDDEKQADAHKPPPAGPSSRLLAPTASTIAKGRGRGKVRGAALHAAQQTANSGIPRRPAGAPRALAVPPRTDSRLPHAASGRVAEARRKFDAPAASSFVSPVAAMRPGHSSMATNPATANGAANGTSGQVRRAPGTSTKPHAAKPAAKSSTAAMREAARKAEAIRAHAAASARRPVAGKAKALQTTGSNDSLFKNIGRSTSTRPITKVTATQQRTRPTPLSTDSSDGGASSSSDDGRRGAIPIPAAKGKQADANTSSAASSSAAESADSSSRWGGVTSMLAMLSPSSWKAQAEEAKQHETPTGVAAARKNSSPYDVASPQTPYQPRPEHASSRSQLVMPTYQDMSVPLRRSSGRESTSSEASAGAPRRRSRVSGVSSLFTDDSVSVRQSTSGVEWPGGALARAKSTSDLNGNDPALVTPVQNGRRVAPKQRISSARSDNYTSIIPVGSDSPPEIESDYSDEYSDDEFSPAPRPKKNDFRIPKWATTPELAKGLQRQELVNPDRIFGRVKPLRINDVFNRSEGGEKRRKPRNSSMIWSGADALTADEELEYIRRMGFE
ncbi:hypothetical protein IW140_002595 [Coemansia sp. RSA 1813]|nr:hypothetical protein LPJ74_001232 [Coemansia sp. RSA 1843]KAJ2216139.1 hypothetical protein EV179_001599 [Coemansia sp. RSA 487]KAJ2570125.1 hypothetical protein IW140_002595 [Coemansia sp. RSA 1813]